MSRGRKFGGFRPQKTVSNDWREASVMKASYVAVVLGMYAMSSVAQSSLASFGNGDDFFIVGKGTANLEDRIGLVATNDYLSGRSAGR